MGCSTRFDSEQAGFFSSQHPDRLRVRPASHPVSTGVVSSEVRWLEHESDHLSQLGTGASIKTSFSVFCNSQQETVKC
jgi:hypothetical protein